MQAQISADISYASALLRVGNVVGIPTETVYGLAANALDSHAVLRIFEVKNRPHFDPLIVHVGDMDSVVKYVAEFPEVAQKLAQAFWPGPLTIVMKKADIIPDVVTSGLDTVGIRMPAHPLALELLRQLNFPLAAPSANPFGYVSPTTAQHVQEQLGDRIPMILDGGKCSVGVESTIIDCTTEVPTVLRLGGTSVEKITAIIGKVNVNTNSSSSPAAPGMLLSHYAPRKKIILGNLDALIQDPQYTNAAVLSFSKKYEGPLIMVLSERGDLTEAAQNLFAAMRSLDASNCDFILTEEVPGTGLGRAINDRLQRASYKG